MRKVLYKTTADLGFPQWKGIGGGVEIADCFPVSATVDRLVIGTASKSALQDEYYVDNLSFEGASELDVKAMTTGLSYTFLFLPVSWRIFRQ